MFYDAIFVLIAEKKKQVDFFQNFRVNPVFLFFFYVSTPIDFSKITFVNKGCKIRSYVTYV